MRQMLITLVAITMFAVGCTNESAERLTTTSRSSGTESPTDEARAEIEIYSAVIRRLVTKDHTFGRGTSPFKYVYVVDGPINDAGDPREDLFGPASKPFSTNVIDGIEEELRDLPPVRFVADGNDMRRGKEGMGGVKKDGVIISLGSIERKKDRVNVSNGLWCGGLCGQWMTYVLTQEGGGWKISGTTGPYVIS